MGACCRGVPPFPGAMDLAVPETALIPRYAVVMLRTAMNAAAGTPTITVLSPSSRRTPKIAPGRWRDC